MNHFKYALSQMAEELLSIGELAQQAGVATSALRYYEELGLLHPAARISGRRHYERADVGIVGVISLLSDIGFTLREIKQLMVARSKAAGSWRELTRRKLSELDEHLAKVQAAHLFLEHALRCRHEDITQCPKFREVVGSHLAGTPLRAHSH